MCVFVAVLHSCLPWALTLGHFDYPGLSTWFLLLWPLNSQDRCLSPELWPTQFSFGIFVSSVRVFGNSVMFMDPYKDGHRPMVWFLAESVSLTVYLSIDCGELADKQRFPENPGSVVNPARQICVPVNFSPSFYSPKMTYLLIEHVSIQIGTT